MRAIVIDQFGGPEVLREAVVEEPTCLENEVLIEVAYSGVNPVDWKIREGLLQNRLPYEFPIILGWDVSGVVSKVGSGVTSLKKGDEVMAYCRKPVVHAGSLAEFIVLDEAVVAKKPKTLSMAEAASLPLVSLTAWQALFEEAKLKTKEKILIHAGAGGVGGMAIQFAHRIGAFVITTASSKNLPYVKSLGADKAIDYNAQSFTDEIHKTFKEGIDVVFDCIGGDALLKSLEVLKKGGRLVSIVEPLDPSLGKKNDIKIGYTFVRPDGKMLQEIANLFGEGKLKIPTIEQMGFDDIKEAQEKIKKGHTQGKIVLKSWNKIR